jgi:hypothetical protein
LGLGIVLLGVVGAINVGIALVQRLHLRREGAAR